MPASARPDPADRPTWVDRIDNPYLHGIHAPITSETTAFDLDVEGDLPEDLCGAYVRNGPNSIFEPTNLYHWFDGDGMVHGVYFRDGRASYRSRFVQTEGLREETREGRALWPGIMGPYDLGGSRDILKDTANTDLVFHNGRVLALWYQCGIPYALDARTLETIGLIVVTGVVGAAMARSQGLRVLSRLREEMSAGQMPADSLLDGVMILVASALLVTPGVLTDAFGFLCLVPGFRDLLKRIIVRRIRSAIEDGRVQASVRFDGESNRRVINVRPPPDDER